ESCFTSQLQASSPLNNKATWKVQKCEKLANGDCQVSYTCSGVGHQPSAQTCLKATPNCDTFKTILGKCCHSQGANLTNAPLQCYGKSSWCRLLIDSEFVSIAVLIPSMMMLIFGLLTILSIHKVTLRQIQPITKSGNVQIINNNEQPQRLKKSDRYLLLMLLIQVILLTLFSLPQAIQNLYSHITQYETELPLNIAINDFIFNLFFLLTYVTNGIPFYIYTLCGGTIFRKALLDFAFD
ncbi:unnamed protein product, partial [Adineta steineri]